MLGLAGPPTKLTLGAAGKCSRQPGSAAAVFPSRPEVTAQKVGGNSKELAAGVGRKARTGLGKREWMNRGGLPLFRILWPSGQTASPPPHSVADATGLWTA